MRRDHSRPLFNVVKGEQIYYIDNCNILWTESNMAFEVADRGNLGAATSPPPPPPPKCLVQYVHNYNIASVILQQ